MSEVYALFLTEAKELSKANTRTSQETRRVRWKEQKTKQQRFCSKVENSNQVIGTSLGQESLKYRRSGLG